MHTEGEEQFIASTVGQVPLKSHTLWPIKELLQVRGRDSRGVPLQLWRLQHRPPADNGDRFPLLLSSPQLPHKAEPRGDGAPILAQRVVGAFPHVEKQMAPSYPTSKINKIESLLLFCKQDFPSKKLY